MGFNSQNVIYLDNNSTTKIDDRVIDIMVLVMKELYANPSSSHSFGKTVKKMIDFFPTPLKGWMDHWRREHSQRPLGLKLCGAGGGGFFLLMTRDPATAHMARQQAVSFGFELINLSHD